MTARAHVRVDAETLESVAFNYGLQIELATDSASLTLDGITFVADLPAVA